MNDTMSLLLATGILAVGGLGLIMYKTGSNEKDDNEYEKDDSENDNNGLFDLRSYFGNSNEDDSENEEYKYKEPEVYEQPKRSRGSKTKSSRKNTGTKRRY
jgi:hypothetical protein